MKNSKEYGARLQKLYRGLKRAHPKVEKTTHDDPIEALIQGVVSDRNREAATLRAMKGFRGTFVDWNDLRVSRAEEIIEILQEDNAKSRATAFSLLTALRAVFDEFHTLSLQPLKKMGKRPAKQAIEALDGVGHFVVSYCMLTALQGHAIPLTETMATYLKQNDIVDPEADAHDIEGFLTRQVAAKNAYEFYSLLRRESEAPKIAKKKTKRARKTTKKRKVAKAKK
jgi:endonuclease III